MKKLGKLNLKQLKNETDAIERIKLQNYIGGAVSQEVWYSWTDDQKAQYIIDSFIAGSTLEIEGLDSAGWQTGACGASVTINGKSYDVIVSLNSLTNYENLGDFGYYLGSDYENSCGEWTKGYVGGFGNNQHLMMNPDSDDSDEFYTLMNQNRF